MTDGEKLLGVSANLAIFFARKLNVIPNYTTMPVESVVLR